MSAQLRAWPRELRYAIAIVIGFAFAFSMLFQVRGPVADHYVYLARAFARGEPWVDGFSGQPDIVRWNGHDFLPLGPLPAVVLLPFLPLLNAGMQLLWVSHLLTAGNLLLMRSVLARCGVSDERRVWALLAFFASTPYLGVWLVGTSYFFAHVLTTTLIVLAMREAAGRNRGFLVGIALGLAFATRQTALFGAPFGLWLAWRASDRSATRLLRHALAVAAGVAIPASFVLLYNWARFGNVLESGYGLAVLQNPILEEARSYGLLSLVHVPKNLFMMLLQGPQPYPNAGAAILQPPYVIPSPWGMGLAFTTPALVYAFKADRGTAVVQAAWLAVVATLVPLLLYYGVGWIQFGYRYALDFLPYLVPVCALGMRGPQVTRTTRVLVLVGVAVCIWGAIFLYLFLPFS